MSASIIGMSHCLPRKQIANSTLIDSFGEREVNSIVKMAGIEQRRVADAGQTSVDFGCQAADRLLTALQIDRATIDLVIFGSQTGDYQIPASAYVVHERLGLSKNCAAFDIGLGCTSYPYTLAIANGLISTGVARRALLINGDVLTSVIHPGDRGLVPLHGDGAACTLVERTDQNGFLAFDFGSDGTGWRHLCIPVSGARNPRSSTPITVDRDDSGSTRSNEHLQMNGPAIFHFSVHAVPKLAKDLLAKAKVTLDDVDLVVMHQANRTMIDLIYKALRVPDEKRFYFLKDVGNLSGASTPVTLSEAWRSGRVRPGSIVMLLSFGVGLSWAGALLRLPALLPSTAEIDTVYQP